MTDDNTNVIRFSDYQPKPRKRSRAERPATIMLLPVVTIENPRNSEPVDAAKGKPK